MIGPRVSIISDRSSGVRLSRQVVREIKREEGVDQIERGVGGELSVLHREFNKLL